MLELARLLALAAFIALALAIFVFLRRAGRLLAESRQREAFRRTVLDLVERVGTSLDGVAGRIDQVRRHTLGVEQIEENLAAATDAVARYAQEARALNGVGPQRELREAILGDLDRAGRALEMVAHGCEILRSGRVAGREIEAETSIKRGYLNILHAREAIARQGARVVEVTTVEPPRLFQRRNA